MSSFLSRISLEMGNALLDAYGNLMYGDDAGKSAKLVFVAKPRQIRKKPPTTPTPKNGNPANQIAFDLGMTFIEVNTRAYVKTVTPDSPAALAGVQPRDAVQFAFVRQDCISSNSKDVEDEDEKAAQYALDAERKGLRTTFTEMCNMFPFDITRNPNADDDRSEQNDDDADSKLSDLKKLVKTEQENPTRSNMILPLSISGDPVVYPVTIVFRRTRQRRSLVGGGMPHFMIPNFRLDDECDRAACLIRKLAPTADTAPQPDAWDEIVHDGTEWLFPDGSIMPPATPSRRDPFGEPSSKEEKSGGQHRLKRSSSNEFDGVHPTGEDTIPADSWEAKSSEKISMVQMRMQEEAKLRAANNEAVEDVEAKTIRGLIQKAVGLAFVRASKIVLGVSIHGGSGIVIARLPDGTWSAPSAIGTWGLGLGLQFGLEVADYIFILQTADSLAHFRSGGHFTIGGNVGAAVAGLGREAYGAASVKGSLCAGAGESISAFNEESSAEVAPLKEDASEISPIVAYAKSQGLYFGVSLEGSRIFTRDDLNARTYKFTTGKTVNANDILSGKVRTPHEAEDLYASLHSVEFAHEISCLPRPPGILRSDSPNDWRFDRSTLANDQQNGARDEKSFSFFSTITDRDTEECSEFETKFKKFLYGGVSVQRLVPNAEPTRGYTRRERRTLWLMLPEVGSLRLGFISKLNDWEEGDKNVSPKKKTGDDGTVGDDYTADGESLYSLVTEEATEYSVDGTITSNLSTVEKHKSDQKEAGAARHSRTGKVHLSSKYSLALTDVTCLSQEPKVSIRFSPDDATEHLRVVSIQDVNGTSLLFLANNFREAELLMCGLKLLLERETARLGLRGGMLVTELNGKRDENGVAIPSTPRSYPAERRGGGSVSSPDFSNSEGEDDSLGGSRANVDVSTQDGYSVENVPEGRASWSKVPGRDYLREVASRSNSGENENPNTTNVPSPAPTSQGDRIPKYTFGELILRDIASKVQLPLPLPLCRALLLDSSSPVITKWEAERGDANYQKTKWSFPPASPRELERHTSEHKLIASGSMVGAHRTSSYSRLRNGDMVHLTETQIVDADDTEKLALTITERTPRRGFTIKIRILFRASSKQLCEGTVLGEVRPMGKNMTNQKAVHKAFCLVLNEITMRYGTEGKGLMAFFLNVLKSGPIVPSPSNAGSANNVNDNGSFTYQQPIVRIQPQPQFPPVQPQPTIAQQLMQRQSSNNQQQQMQQPMQQPMQKQQQQMQNQQKQMQHQQQQQQKMQNLQHQMQQHQMQQQQMMQQQQQMQQRKTSQPRPPHGVLPTAQTQQLQMQQRISPTAQQQQKQQQRISPTAQQQLHSRQFTQYPQHQQNPSPTSVIEQRLKQHMAETRQTSSSNQSQPSTRVQPLPSTRITGATGIPVNNAPPQPTRSIFKPPMVDTNLPIKNSALTPSPQNSHSSLGGFTKSLNDASPVTEEKKPLTIEVKPLPKIRLSLMPSPREEDEDNASESTGSPEAKLQSRNGNKNASVRDKKKKTSSRKSGTRNSSKRQF